MDPLTHALFGASSASLRSRRGERRMAIICGITGGLLPDIDIVFKSKTDPLFGLEMHRQFTHCLAFIPVGGLVAALMLWPFLRKKVLFWRVWMFTTLGYALHGVVDAMTSYGTHLLWPFSNVRTSWNNVSIIDPVVTLTLFTGVFLCYRKHSRKPVAICVALVAAYLCFGVFQNHRAEQAAIALAESRGHKAERLNVKPSFANLVVWRSTYLSGDKYYVDAVRVSFGGNVRVYEGGSIAAIDPQTVFPEVPEDSVTRRDIKRFSFFSDEFVVSAPGQENVIADLRFALLPQRLDPLWGIQIDPKQPDAHTPFISLRRREPGDVATLWKMIQGQDL